MTNSNESTSDAAASPRKPHSEPHGESPEEAPVELQDMPQEQPLEEPQEAPGGDRQGEAARDASQGEARDEQPGEAHGDRRADPSCGEPSGDEEREKTSPKSEAPELDDEGLVTLMVGQLPHKMTQVEFVQEVNSRGYEGLYDFLFVPFDFRKELNLGYGFVNFVHPRHAQKFRRDFDGLYFNEDMRQRNRPVRIHAAKTQGYEANFMQSQHRNMSYTGHPLTQPLFFRHGAGELLSEQHGKKAPTAPIGAPIGAGKTAAARRLEQGKLSMAPGKWPVSAWAGTTNGSYWGAGAWQASAWDACTWDAGVWGSGGWAPPPGQQWYNSAPPRKAQDTRNDHKKGARQGTACLVCGALLPRHNFCTPCGRKMLQTATAEYAALKTELAKEPVDGVARKKWKKVPLMTNADPGQDPARREDTTLHALGHFSL